MFELILPTESFSALEQILTIVVSISVLLTYYVIVDNRNIKKSYIPILDIVEHMLSLSVLSRKEVKTYLDDLMNDFNYLTISCHLIYDKICLTKIFIKHNQGGQILPSDLTNARVRILYNLGVNKSKIVQTALLGMLCLQAKISAINCHPDSLRYRSQYNTIVITKIPTTIEQLFDILLVLHNLCKELNINYSVYESYSLPQVMNTIQNEHFEEKMYQFEENK